MANPSSQKADVCPISFVVDDQNDGSSSSLTLAIRPEDLNRAEPMRVSVVQTLGGAFADDFGRGLPTIQIAGHTGWNRYTDGGLDGAERFQQLYDKIITEVQSRREAAVLRGDNPDRVRLIFADGLNNKVDVVKLTQFSLRRNKARPLLAQYSISMTALGIRLDAAALDPAQNLLTVAGALNDLGLASLADSFQKFVEFTEKVGNFIEENIAGPIKAFMNAAVAVVQKVQFVMGSALRAISNITTPLLNLATSVAKAGQQLMTGLTAVLAFPSAVKAQFMQVASAFSNTFCLLRNAFRRAINFPDFSDLYGSSNCSSTSGGRPLSPLSGTNPWKSLYPTNVPLVSVTAPAAAAMQQLADSDPVLAPLPASQLLDAARGFGSGVSVTA